RNTEHRRRFGEYPEEVEHLFATVELKILARQLGFVKVELREHRMLLEFPPNDATWFFGNGDGEDASAPFQALMAKTQHLQPYKPQLKQDGKRLRLQVVLQHDTVSPDFLKSARNFLEALY
ncbi:MAG TPA: TRCF domain-containing protein, partial [Bacteroidota bacterium]